MKPEHAQRLAIIDYRYPVQSPMRLAANHLLVVAIIALFVPPRLAGLISSSVMTEQLVGNLFYVVYSTAKRSFAQA
jgi:hypothetical protein